jgi:hypothetical protein
MSDPISRNMVWRNLTTIAAALIIAAAILISMRFQIIAAGDSGIYRLDRITGAMHICLPVKDHPFDLACPGDDWVKVPSK